MFDFRWDITEENYKNMLADLAKEDSGSISVIFSDDYNCYKSIRVGLYKCDFIIDGSGMKDDPVAVFMEIFEYGNDDGYGKTTAGMPFAYVDEICLDWVSERMSFEDFKANVCGEFIVWMTDHLKDLDKASNETIRKDRWEVEYCSSKKNENNDMVCMVWNDKTKKYYEVPVKEEPKELKEMDGVFPLGENTVDPDLWNFKWFYVENQKQFDVLKEKYNLIEDKLYSYPQKVCVEYQDDCAYIWKLTESLEEARKFFTDLGFDMKLIKKGE